MKADCAHPRQRVSLRMAADTVRYAQRFLAALNPTYTYRACQPAPPPRTPAATNVKQTVESTATPTVVRPAGGPPPTLKSVATALVSARRMQQAANGATARAAKPVPYQSRGHRSDLVFRALPDTLGSVAS